MAHLPMSMGKIRGRGGSPLGGSAAVRLPPAGAYRLTIRLARPVRVRVGRLGVVTLPAGTYHYCGSARRNLPARVARHLRRGKQRHWHVDYLLASPAAEVTAVSARADRGECDLVAAAIRAGATAPVPGFGSSDCRRRCPAHLLRLAGPRRDLT